MADIGFLLAEDFALMHLGLAQEALRIANRLAAQRQFKTRLYCVDDTALAANNGQVILPTHKLAEPSLPDALFVIASLRPEQVYNDSVAGLLKRFARSGKLLGAIDCGASFLARNGLIDQQQVAVHWEYAATFAELYPGIAVSTEGMHLSGRLLSCSGGLAVGQMMVETVAQLAGRELAHRMAEVLYYSRIDTDYFGPDRETGEPLDIIEQAQHLMLRNLNRPLTLDQLVAKLPISKRSLVRRFQQQGKPSPMLYYRRLRLQHARSLIQETGLSVKRAAYASGFSSPAHLSKAYLEYFGVRPGEHLVKPV